MAANKVRIFAEVAGGHIQLFSVTETARCDLSINPNRRAFVSDGDEVNRHVFTENRFSVHVSPRAQGHTIIHHLSYNDGNHRKLTSAAYMEFDADACLWPILSSSVNLANRKSLKIDLEASRRNIVIAKYDQSTATMVYQIWFAPIEQDLNLTGSGSWSVVKFKCFQLIVTWYFHSFSTFESGRYLSIATNRRTEGDQKPDRVEGVKRAQTMEQARAMHAWIATRISRGLVRHFFEIYESGSREEQFAVVALLSGPVGVPGLMPFDARAGSTCPF